MIESPSTGQTPVHLLPAVEVAAMFRDKTLSPVEYMTAVLGRIDEANPHVNAIVDLYSEDALTLAAQARERYQHGRPRGPIDGLPVAIKDETPVKGRRTTCGSLLSPDVADTESAVVVSRIQESGGIVHARTATPEYCCAPFTHSLRWGVTRNPWNPQYSPGGSSGGAAVALALGMTPLADGSDVGGSIRIPSAFCGVVGYKPPYGRVPGVPPSNLDPYCHQGPLARTVQDCALLQDVISGPHPDDPATVPGLVRVSGPDDDIAGWRIAVCADGGGFPCSAEVRQAVRDAAAAFTRLGAHVEEIDVGWTFDQVQAAARIHTGVTFGAELSELGRNNPEQMTRYARRVGERAAQVAKEEYPQGLRIENGIHRAMADVFKRYRVLLCPTMSTTGLLAGEDYVDAGPDVDGVATTKHRDVMPTLIFNICSRNPVISVPIGTASNGIPIGMQIAGAPFDDRSVFTAARAWQWIRPWPLSQGFAIPTETFDSTQLAPSSSIF